MNKAHILLVFIMFISRLPFIFNGFGVEEDSWGLVLNSYEMREEGRYIHSRLPGHPVQEFVYYAIYNLPDYIYNGLSALFTAMAAIYFFLILRLAGFRMPFLTSLAFMFVPVIYINSVSTIDYNWALALILASVYYFIRGKFLLSGLFLGLAFGCRITSALMFLPLIFFYWEENRIIPDKNILRFSGWFALICLVTYAMPLREYGLGIFNTYQQVYPPIPKVIFKGSFGVFGALGLLAILYYLLRNIAERKQHLTKTIKTPIQSSLMRFSWVTLGIHTLLYILMPYKSAFLIPAVPFSLVLLNYYVRNEKTFMFFLSGLLISPFVFGIDLTDAYRGSRDSGFALKTTISSQEIYFDPFLGPVLNDYSKRKVKAEFYDKAIEKITILEPPALIIAGWWYNQLLVELRHRNLEPEVLILDHVSEELLNNYYRYGFGVYALPEISKYNDIRYNGNFTGKYARELKFLYE